MKPLSYGYLLFCFSSILYCQISNGQTHKASPDMWPNIDSLIEITNRPVDDTNKVKAFHMLSASSAGMDPAKAVMYGKKGAVVGKRIGYRRGLANCYFNMAYAYGLMGNSRSAVSYMDSAIVIYKELGRTSLLPILYYNRAEQNVKLGRLKEALSDCDIAYNYAIELNRKGIIEELYKTIADIYYLQNNFEQSKNYYEKSYRENEEQKDTVTMATLLNKLGKVYESKKDYGKSILNYEKAISLSTKISHENEIAENYTNLSIVWMKKGDMKKAELNAMKAIEYARKKNNKIQLAQAQAALSNVYLQRDSTAMAIQTAVESYQEADSINVFEAKKKSADALAESYFKSGDFKNAYYYLNISKALTDSIASDRFSNELASMQTSFKVAEKDNEIRLLGKDKDLQRHKLRQQKYLAIAAIAVAFLALGGIWLLIYRNKLKQRMAELELRNRIAADLHDEVGSSLSSIHMLSQMATQPGNEATHIDILSRMSTNAKETMDKMGDIVWMIKPETEAGSLRQRMERFAYEICSGKNIDIHLRLDELEAVKLSMEQRKNIYLIFKEVLNNAVKYSGAEQITVSTALQNNTLVLLVKDEGSGFDSRLIKKGNGLDNINNRAIEMQGAITIDSMPGKGTGIQLSIPV